jgi:hypothetical protein
MSNRYITRVMPGDLAVINRCPDPVMMGKLVHVGPRIWPTIQDGHLCYFINGYLWTAYADDGPMWLVEAQGYPFFIPRVKDGHSALMGMAPCRDKWLRPLRMTADTDQMVLAAGEAPNWRGRWARLEKGQKNG